MKIKLWCFISFNRDQNYFSTGFSFNFSISSLRLAKLPKISVDSFEFCGFGELIGVALDIDGSVGSDVEANSIWIFLYSSCLKVRLRKNKSIFNNRNRLEAKIITYRDKICGKMSDSLTAFNPISAYHFFLPLSVSRELFARL